MQFCRGGLKDLPRPKGTPLFIALKVISLILNLRPLADVGNDCACCYSRQGD